MGRDARQRGGERTRLAGKSDRSAAEWGGGGGGCQFWRVLGSVHGGRASASRRVTPDRRTRQTLSGTNSVRRHQPRDRLDSHSGRSQESSGFAGGCQRQGALAGAKGTAQQLRSRLSASPVHDAAVVGGGHLRPVLATVGDRDRSADAEEHFV